MFRTIPCTFRAVLLAAACAALAFASGVVPACTAAAADAPRLILPGARTVEPGQWIDLRWSAADSVTEMEILLSRDGGRTYEERISPQLDPNHPHLLWRVPGDAGRELRLRIRFNRGGREIEAAPAAPLRVVRAGATEPEPLALPLAMPANDAPVKPAGERVPGSPGAAPPGPAEDAERAGPVSGPAAPADAALLCSPERIPAADAARRVLPVNARLAHTRPLRP
jgi:hypothetical protein